MNAEERKRLDDCGKGSFMAAYMNWGHTQAEAEKAWDKVWEQHEVNELIRNKSFLTQQQSEEASK